jgi:preprotein translocase subunit YajC
MPGFSFPAVFAMAPPQGGGGPVWVQFLPFALILAIFYFIILLPMKRRQKKVAEFRDALKVGDKVITTAGIYGSITKLNEKSVQLQVADKVRIEISRAAVGGLQGQDPVVQDSASM